VLEEQVSIEWVDRATVARSISHWRRLSIDAVTARRCPSTAIASAAYADTSSTWMR
jgi:hypothetical protein